MIWLYLQDAFWSAVAAIGFAMLFNIPRRNLAGCALAGAVGHSLRLLLLEWGVTIELGTLITAVIIGFLSELLARHYRVPAPLFSVPGVIPMVPGSFAFRAMLGILEIANLDAANGSPILVEASANAIKTGLILAALAGGIAAPSLLFQRNKPVV